MFKENNDDSKNYQMVIPANIRFKFYPTREDVVLENKFAALPLQWPVTDDMASAYPAIQKCTKFLKNSISIVYALYAMNFWSNLLLPRFIVR